MTTILAILFIVFIWSLCRIGKKQEPGIPHIQSHMALELSEHVMD
ncbi:MAG: hypothetical protein NT022_12435 [Deltaproteobacteria bacterium]|nr:hypothetical protein [Deltaproteobacteria bacterium]